MIKFWKKFKDRIILLLIIIIIVIIGFQILKARDRQIAEMAAANAILEYEFQHIDSLRYGYKVQLKSLQSNYDSLQSDNEQIRKEKAESKEQLIIMAADHAAEIAALKNIPPDTVYQYLFVRHPSQNLPLKYRFSAPQVKSIYAEVKSYDNLKVRYSFQKSILEQCSNLNTGYRNEIGNLKGQNAILGKDLNSAERQTQIQTQKYNNVNKAYNSTKTWNNVFKGLAVIELIIILAK